MQKDKELKDLRHLADKPAIYGFFRVIIVTNPG